jgi:hypothetical protein
MPALRLVPVLAVAALASPLAALPAAAAPPAPACASVSASAGADLVRVSALDARLARPAPVGFRIASSHVDASGTRSTATARGLDATLAGAAFGVPDTAAIQQAPPAPSGSGSQVAARAVDAGVARVGTGDLRARTAWRDGCPAVPGPAASSSAVLADATVLPGPGGRSLLRAPRNVSSGASVQANQRTTSASAHVSLGELHLFDGADGGVQVRVLSEPALTAIAGGTVARSSVRYAAPVLEVAGPNGNARRIEAGSRQLDLPVPPGVLAVPGALVLRLSIGTVAQHVTGTSVTAEAGMLRIQLMASGSTLLDLNLGVLQASATAPAAPPVPAPVPGQGGGPTLPVTGLNAGWLVGIGILIAIGGRLLLLLSRRPRP